MISAGGLFHLKKDHNKYSIQPEDYALKPLYVAATDNRMLNSKLASLNRSWQSKEGTYRALGMAGIEPTPSKSTLKGLDPAFALNTRLRGR